MFWGEDRDYGPNLYVRGGMDSHTEFIRKVERGSSYARGRTQRHNSK